MMSFNSASVEQIKAEAIENGMEVEALLAVALVESAGVAFWKIDGKEVPAIRIEGHYFHRILKERDENKLAEAVRQGLADPKAGQVRNPKSWAGRYAMFERMCKIDRVAAIESCSWGLGQVMGANWRNLGYRSASHFMDSAQTVRGQIDMMVRFIMKNNLDDELRDHRWADFARVYNGPAYKKNKYHTKMAEAYSEFKGAPAVTIELVESEFTREVQRDLKLLGYNVIVDGMNGPMTTRAIERFQADQGLEIDGLAGPMTREAITRELERRESEKARRRTIQVGGGGVATTVAVDKVVEGMEQAESLGQRVKNILQSFEVNDIIVVVIVSAVIGFVLYNYVKKVHNDRVNESEA